ncbi:hypothetical protein DFP73DRAFT_601393 [Morchella snyderi]|nr:hypothetical protein DFP73DRAFT_601393 [Morchella snyderi]
MATETPQISQDLIIHNPGQVVKALVPDVGNFMTDLDSSILEAEEAPMGRLFEFIQNILREQGQAHLSHLEHLMGYFQEREEATRFALGLAHDDMDRRVRLLEDTLTRQMAEGSIGTEDGPQAMDFEYTKLTILPPPAQLSIPIMMAVSERRFTGRKVPTDLMWSLDKVRKIRKRRDLSPTKRAHPAISRGNTPTPETPRNPFRIAAVPDLRPVEPLPIRPYNTPVAAYKGTPFHNIRGPGEVPPPGDGQNVEWERLTQVEEENLGEEFGGRQQQEEAGVGGGGGQAPPRGRSGAGAPDPGDDDSDSSDDEPRDWNDRRERRQWLKRRDRRLLRTIRDLFDPSRPVGLSATIPARLPPKKSIAPEPFKGELDDLDRFIRALEGVFELDKAHYVSDMDKISVTACYPIYEDTFSKTHSSTKQRRSPVTISYTSSLLRDRASKWYETIHAHVNEEAAKRLGLPFDSNSPWRKWTHFLSSMTSSFGGSLTREKAVGEWRSLKHVAGKIDEFIDKSIELVMRTGYTDEASIKDHILQCLHRDLYREWARVLDQLK